MKKRILSWLLVMCMICSLLPATALAVEDDAGGETTAACTVTDGCTLEAGHEGDCVLPGEPEETTGGDANSYYETDDVIGGGDAPEPADPACAGLEGCTEDTQVNDIDGAALSETITESDLQDAINNSNGTAQSPEVITIPNDIGLTKTLTIPNGKFVKLVGKTGNEIIKPAETANVTDFSYNVYQYNNTGIGRSVVIVGGIEKYSDYNSRDGISAGLTLCNITIDAGQYSDSMSVDCRNQLAGELKNASGVASDKVLRVVYLLGNAETTYIDLQEGSKLTGGTAWWKGPGITAWSASVYINGGIVCDNLGSSDFDEGAISVVDGGKFELSDGEVYGNYNCHGIYVSKNVELTITGGKVFKNSKMGIRSQDVRDEGTPEIRIEGCSVYENEGGGIAIGSGTIKNAEIYKNKTEKNGAGLYIGSGVTLIDNCKIYENTVATTDENNNFGGAGIYYAGKENTVLTIRNTEIKSNSINNNNGSGLLISGQNTTVLCENCVFSKNTGGSAVCCGTSNSNTITLQMDGGTVTESPNGINGVGSFTVRLSGDVQIKDNSTEEGKSRNIYLLSDNQFIEIVEKLGSQAEIGLTHAQTHISKVLSVENAEYRITNDDMTHLFSDSEEYFFYLNENRIMLSEAKDALEITLNSNTGSNSETSTQKVPKGQSTTLDTNSFVRDGYTFMGWNTQLDGNGTKYSDGAEVTFTNAATLYAQWIETSQLKLTTDKVQVLGANTLALSAPSSASITAIATGDTDVITVSGTSVTPVDGTLGQTADVTATVSHNGYSFPVDFKLTVSPRQLTYSAGGQDNPGSITYSFSEDHTDLSSLMTFKWKDGDTTVTLNEGEDIDYTYTVPTGSGGTGQEATVDFLPMPVGTYQVKFNLKNPNYIFANTQEGGTPLTSLTITVNVTNAGQTRAYLAAITPVGTSFTYDGTGKLPVSGTLTAYAEDSTSSNVVEIDTFTVMVEGLNDTTFHGETPDIPSGTNLADCDNLELPEEPGTYVLTISASTDTHYIYKSQVFTIDKATVTIKADDKSVYVGDDMPELTYTVSGLASGDSLRGTVSLSCEATDTNTAGTYTITPSGAAVPDTNHYNSEIVYQPGTLTILSRGGGGGGGSSSGGSSSSNVSGSGDDVSISASGGSVTSSQMESAVNKADEGSTITIKATSSTTVSLPVGGMADAADNDNDVLLDLRYGEVTLSARTIAGLTDGVSSSGKIKVSITSQTSSKDETISDLLDKGAAVFDVSVTVNDVEVHSFDSTLTITLTVSNLSKITDPHILHILTDGTKEYYAPDSISGNTITVKGVRNLSTFAVIPGSEVPEEQTNPFTDVYESDYYYDAVLWAVANGVTNGTSATTFGPNVTVTRAQMVTFLWRAYGSPEATGANPFTAVSTSDYYSDAVLWAVDHGGTNGTSATTFSPDMAVTRAQAVTFQWRAAGSPVVSGSSFGDVSADAYYADAVTWAVANGITNGTGGNTFSPDLVVSRAQAVTFLYREQE